MIITTIKNRVITVKIYIVYWTSGGGWVNLSQCWRRRRWRRRWRHGGGEGPITVRLIDTHTGRESLSPIPATIWELLYLPVNSQLVSRTDGGEFKRVENEQQWRRWRRLQLVLPLISNSNECHPSFPTPFVNGKMYHWTSLLFSSLSIHPRYNNRILICVHLSRSSSSPGQGG